MKLTYDEPLSNLAFDFNVLRPYMKDMEDEARFTELIKSIMDRHNNVVPMIARGVLELKLEAGSGHVMSRHPPCIRLSFIELEYVLGSNFRQGSRRLVSCILNFG